MHCTSKLLVSIDYFVRVTPLMRREVHRRPKIPRSWNRLRECPKKCLCGGISMRPTTWIWGLLIIWVRKCDFVFPSVLIKIIYRGRVPRTKRIRFHAPEIVRGMGFEYIFANLLYLVKEPGQARHASIGSFPTASALNLGRNLEIGSGSHKSSLFPWDNAGPSSSVAALPFEMGSDRFSLGQDDVRLRDASVGRSSGREGSLVASQLNSGPGTLGFSPKTFEKIGSHINDSFEFDGRDSKALTHSLLIGNLQFQREAPCKETLGWNPI